MIKFLGRTETPRDDITLFATLLVLPTGGLPAINVPPQHRKALLFDALIRQVERLSLDRPVLLTFEDVHWADPTTRELLDDLVERVRAFRVLLVITFRPEFVAPWTDQAGVTLLSLSRLDRVEATNFVLRSTMETLLPNDIIDRIVAQSDGVPLFIEELTKAVMETAGVAIKSDDAVAVPDTLRASLLARLDRMPVAKQVAQVCAVIGREFSYSLISEVAELPAAILNEGLDQLVTAGLLFRRGVGPEASYIFKHALVQDAAYDSLLRARRVRLHAAIGAALERDEDLAKSRPWLPGHHFALAGNPEKALSPLSIECERAFAESAMTEGRQEAIRGLALAGQIKDGPVRVVSRARFTLFLVIHIFQIPVFARLNIEKH